MSTVRAHEVDALRGVALLGICIVNLPFLAGIDLFAIPQTAGDLAAGVATAALFQGKFFTLFSFLFGWGFAVQIRSAERDARPFAAEYTRRLLGLMVIGIAHALLVFTGDILVLYALLGALLYGLRNQSSKSLMKIAISLTVLSVFSLGLLVIILDELAVADVNGAVLSGYLGGFFDAAGQRLWEWPFAFGFILLFNGPMALAAFCAGLAAAKSRFFEPDSSSYAALKQRMPLLLVLGVLLNAGYALSTYGWLGEDVLALAGFAGLAIGAPCLSALYLIGVVELVRRGWLSTSTLAAGRMSLTAYIGEGVLAGLLFNGYGLGYLGQFGLLACMGLAIAVYLVVHLGCALWLGAFLRGPLESLLRWITRGFT